MSLSGVWLFVVSLLAVHVVVVQTMLRLFEDSFLPITPQDFELIPSLAVVRDGTILLHICQREDVCDSVGTKPHFSIAREHSSQLGNCLASLGVDGQAAMHFVDVSQQFRVGEGVSCGLAVQENPTFWDSSAIDAVLEEGCTPVFIIVAEEQVISVTDT